MPTPSLIIAGREISIISWLDYDQSIEPIGGASTRRMGGGSAFKLTHWNKWRISITASGWIPAALLGVNYGEPFEIELPWPEAFAVGDPLPAGWTQRAAPWDEKPVTDQAGFPVRLVWPKLTVIAEAPRKSHGHSGAPAWNLVMETV